MERAAAPQARKKKRFLWCRWWILLSILLQLWRIRLLGARCPAHSDTGVVGAPPIKKTRCHYVEKIKKHWKQTSQHLGQSSVKRLRVSTWPWIWLESREKAARSKQPAPGLNTRLRYLWPRSGIFFDIDNFVIYSSDFCSVFEADSLRKRQSIHEELTKISGSALGK